MNNQSSRMLVKCFLCNEESKKNMNGFHVELLVADAPAKDGRMRKPFPSNRPAGGEGIRG